MSLILQRNGSREKRSHMRQLKEMDIAYAEAVRLGANALPTVADMHAAVKVADEMEFFARGDLSRIDKSTYLHD